MQGWEEFIYDNRNKLYGSYQLRKKYPKYLFIGFITSLALAAIPLVIIYYNNNSIEIVTELPLGVSIELNLVPDDLKIEPPPPEQKTKKEIEQIPAVADSANTPQKQIVKADEGADVDSALLLAEKLKVEGNGLNSNIDSSFYVYVDNYPDFIGGDMARKKFIQTNIKYPKSWTNTNKHGKIVVTVVITREGRLKDINVIKSVGAEMDQEIIRVLSLSPNWFPANRNGHPVDCVVHIPINL